MSNVYFYLLVLAMLLNTFSLSIGYGKVNRSFLMLSNGLIEDCVILVSDNEIYEPYFDENKLKNNTTIFLKENLGKYSNNSTISIYYFYPESNELCLNHCCRGVSISLKTKVSNLLTYEKTLKFQIMEN